MTTNDDDHVCDPQIARGSTGALTNVRVLRMVLSYSRDRAFTEDGKRILRDVDPCDGCRHAVMAGLLHSLVSLLPATPAAAAELEAAVIDAEEAVKREALDELDREDPGE